MGRKPILMALALLVVACSSASSGPSTNARPIDAGGSTSGLQDAGPDHDAGSVIGVGLDQDGSVATGGPTGTASNWATDLNAAYCTWAIRCQKFADTGACNAYMGPQFAVVNFNAPSAAITAVSNATAQFDRTQAAACLTALSNLDCASDLLKIPRVPAPCAAVFSGGVPDGAECIDDVECASGSMCVVTSTATCKGKCAPASGGSCRSSDDCPSQQYCAAVPLQGSGLWGSGVCEPIIAPGATAGDPCGMPVQCAPGLYCGGGPAPARCEPAVKAGEPCDVPGTASTVIRSCAPGLACVAADDGATATCMVPAKLGEPCTSLFQCGAQYVLNDIVCDETGTHTCVQRRSTGHCSLVHRLSTCDPAKSFCDAASETCKPWLSQGAACVFPSMGGDPCGLWNSCRQSVCAPLLGACTPQ